VRIDYRPPVGQSGFTVAGRSSALVEIMISRSDTRPPMAYANRMQPVSYSHPSAPGFLMSGCPKGTFLAVHNTIPPVISNRIYTFPKYAVVPALYPELERRNVSSRIAVAGEHEPERMRD